MLIKGTDLTFQQRQEVAKTFKNWHLDTTSETFDNWLSKHAFWFTKDGLRLDMRFRYAESCDEVYSH